MADDVLRLFAPETRDWFRETFAEPTDIQARAWPRIAAGEHTLITAPTGSGKTLTAFLWAIDRLFSGAWENGSTRVLYVTPVKALGNDIHRNLIEPLRELQDRRLSAGHSPPEVRIAVRSGDTPQSERRRMLKDPPEILITTPESLNLLLTSRNGRRMLENLESVILDEIHALLESKRGVHLITAVERLVGLSGDFQRVGLSATVHPLELVARWLGGRRITPAGHQDRPVAILRGETEKARRLQVVSSLNDGDALPRDRETFWNALALSLRRLIRRRSSTLIFANSRRMVERVARLLNEGAGERLAWSHHGSLSREIRHVVEQRLKDGELRAIVATSSLELGIDVGAVDEVVMVQCPPSIASTIQRLGRSGHRVGETSRGRICPVHPRDLLQCAVAASAALAGDIEPAQPIRGALDVLAQVVLSMAVGEARPVAEIFDTIRCAEPYRTLSRAHFDLVVEMLAGRFDSSRIRTLRPLISLDRVDDTLRARPGAERLLYLAGGTIPDRGYYQLRLDGADTKLGELDEEFVWERSVGDTFTLGVQSWKIERITHSHVDVSAASSGASLAPFWRADERDGSLHLADRVARLLEQVEPTLEKPGAVERLAGELPLEDSARPQLVSFLAEQMAATSCLPHRHRVLVEHAASSRGRSNEQQVILHTLWGGRVNRALALALQTAWKRSCGARPHIIHDDDCVVLTVPADADAPCPFELVNPGEIEDLLRASLASTGFFGARFREAAGVALLLPRAGRGRRTPLWLHRQRAKEMLDVVREAEGFPLVLEAWRSCLEDGLDLEGLRARLQEVQDHLIEVRHVHTDKPSPLADHALWKQTNELMYEDDRPDGAAAPLRDDLFRELTTNAQLRPSVDPSLAVELDRKLQRLAEGYAPAPGRDLVDWVVERLLMTHAEWRELAAAVARDHGVEEAEAMVSVEARVVGLRRGTSILVTAIEHLPRVMAALGASRDDIVALDGGSPPETATVLRPEATDDDTAVPLTPPELVAERLRFFGPVAAESLAADLTLDQQTIDNALQLLATEQVIIIDQITRDATSPQVCDRENLERLLRLTRARSRPSFDPQPADQLPLFLAVHQDVGGTDDGIEGFRDRLEAVLGWPAPPKYWETEVLPARAEDYNPAWIDTLLIETDLRWLGCGDTRVTFLLEQDRRLLAQATVEELPRVSEAFPHRLGRFTLEELSRHSGRSSADLTTDLWNGVWSGLVSSDTFAPVRTAVRSGFKPELPRPRPAQRRRARRGDLGRWKASRPFEGHWFVLPAEHSAGDALDRDEESRDRVRLLLDRHGILFRRILERELPPFRWGAVFRSLRLMELSGEVVAGCFFQGISGIQFMDPSAFRRLRSGLPEDRVWWFNAADPASVCGLGIDLFNGRLPKRTWTSHLVHHGRRLVLVSEARGKRLRIEPAPDHPELERYFGVLKHLLARRVQPYRHLTVETVNGEAAAGSSFLPAFQKLFHVVRAGSAVRLSRRY